MKRVTAAKRRSGLVTGGMSLLTGRVVSGVATLIATPILFSRLGPSVFGLWAVLLGAAGIAGYADAGLGSTLVRETSKAHISPEAMRRAQGALALAFVVPSVLGLTLAAAIFTTWPVIAPAVGLDALSRPVRDAALLLVASVIVDGWGAAGRAALEGTGRIPRTAAVTAAAALLAAVLGVVAVLDGHGLVGLALATLCGAGARTVAFTVLARRATPDLRPRLRALRRDDLRPLLRYAGAVQLTQAGGAVNGESDRLVLAGVAGAGSAGAFELALRLGNLLALIPFCLLYALFPTLARLAGEGDRQALDAAYRRTSRQIAALSLVPGVLVMACAPSLVVLWLGVPVAFAAACLLALCPAVVARSLTGVASALCRAEGVPGRETRFVMLTALLNVVLTIAMAVALGPIGVPIATATATILAATIFLVRFHRATARPMRLLREALAAPAMAALAAGAAAIAVGSLLPAAADRGQAAFELAARGTAGALAAGAVLGTMGLLARRRGSVAGGLAAGLRPLAAAKEA